MALSKQARQHLIKKAASLTYAIRMRKTAGRAGDALSIVKQYIADRPDVAGAVLGAGAGGLGGAGIGALLGHAGAGAGIGALGGGAAGYAVQIGQAEKANQRMNKHVKDVLSTTTPKPAGSNGAKDLGRAAGGVSGAAIGQALGRGAGEVMVEKTYPKAPSYPNRPVEFVDGKLRLSVDADKLRSYDADVAAYNRHEAGMKRPRVKAKGIGSVLGLLLGGASGAMLGGDAVDALTGR